MLGLSFRELMEGNIRMGDSTRPMRFDFVVRGRGLVLLWHWLGAMTGSVTIDGFVQDARATGDLETSPLRGWMRYGFTFDGPNGEQLRFDGRKKIRFVFFGWTLLRGAVTDAAGRELGDAVLHFKYGRHFLPMLKSTRAFRMPQTATRA